jgi:NAD(P)H dehydrogenase (quinone)
MTIVVTGASGHLGRLVVAGLLDQGVPASQIVAAVRTPAKAAGLAALGVQVREADYDRPQTVKAALADADRVLLISGSEPGRRLEQHQAVISAARDAGVSLLACTSIVRADTSPLLLAGEHQATEEAIAAAGLPFAFLRNGWYFENYGSAIAHAAATGTLTGGAGPGRVSAASRADFAAAAVAVLTSEGQAGQVYELGGDEAWTYADLAAAISAAAGTPVSYQDLSPEQNQAALVAAGLPEGYAAVLADSDQGIARGDLEVRTGDLARLIGRAWPSVGHFFTTLSAAGLTGVLAVLAAGLAVGGFVAIRRVTI